jgi:hypothetical protein
MKTKPKRISRILASSLALAFSLFGAQKLSAQELKPINIEDILHQSTPTIHYPRVDFIFNYGLESKKEQLDYLKGFTYFGGETLVRDANVPELNAEEISQIESLIKDIKSRKVNFYSNFVNLSKNLSVAQKIVLSASLGQLLYTGNYNELSSQNKVESQEIFFKSLQDLTPLGQCSQFSAYIEKLSNESEIKTSAVTGRYLKIAHAFDLLKLNKGTAVVNGGEIFIAKTKNVEEVLTAYQKSVDSTAFQHLFFEDNKFKYMLITKDGRTFLDFIGYDISPNPIKNSLINNTNSDSEITFMFNKKEDLTSFGINYFGFIAKAGKIKGNLEEISLAQVGFNRKLSFSNMEITPNVNLIFQDNRISGGLVELIVNSANEKGINLSSRISGNVVVKNILLDKLFYDYSMGAGASYKFKTRLGDIERYSVAQFKLLMEDLGMKLFVPTFDEAEAGIKLNLPFSRDSGISLNPYYVQKLWERRFGVNAKLKTRWLDLNAEGSVVNSTYDFNPDRYKASIGLSASLGKFDLKLEGKLDQTDYDGEKEIHNSILLTGKLKL